VAEARARVESARLSIQALKGTYRQRQADERGAEDELAYAQREYDRQNRLVTSGIASQAQVDRALQALNAAQQRLASTRQQGTSIRADLDNNPDIEPDQHPAVQLALAELSRAQLNLSYTTITAPIDGVVTRVESLQPGDYINAATPAFALVSDQDLWVEANFKEDQLTHMRVGQTARIRIDAYPDQHLTARVASLSPGTGAQFSVLPPENATGNWVKVVQRLPVRLEFKDVPPGLRSGLSVVVDVDTGMQRHAFSAATAAQP
jgi:membrane fusion protein (multidrug efflux system)